jgi:hypothetical protein
MEPKQHCPNCNRALDDQALQGLCPDCLLKAGWPTGAEGDGSPDQRFALPTLEELAGLFPHLEILALIGRGGMGAVFKARQPRLDRLVALKILPLKEDADPGFAERFAREAQALAKLNHRHIVAVHDYGQVQGFHYFVMEYVDGPNLRQVQQAGTLSPGEALGIIPQICEALQFAHDEGVVHRDIKPENVLLDKQGCIKIADFGLAKIMGTERSNFTLTEPNHVMGTPHYMAPEQVEHPSDVDHRADIYSLGVVFYELLTGELPLGKFQPPSHKVQVDVRLDEVVLKTLAKEPERRYQHAADVKTEVQLITDHPAAERVAEPDDAEQQAIQVSARQRLRRPCALLITVAIINLGLWTWVVASNLIWPEGALALGRVKFSGTLQMLQSVFLGDTLSLLIAIGAWRMRRLGSYPLAVATALLAMVTPPAFVLGAPLGIWILVILCQREVRRAFQQSRCQVPVALRSLRMMRGIARALGSFCMLLMVPFILDKGLPPILQQTGANQLFMAAGFFMILGSITGWWREGTGALLIGLGWTVFQIAQNRIDVSPFHLVNLWLVSAILYCLYWWATQGRRTMRIVLPTLGLGLLLVLGRLFCPSNILLSGIVKGSQNGLPIENAQVYLLDSPGQAPGESPSARSKTQGRYRLLVGWYDKDKRLLVRAPGFESLSRSLPSRAWGERQLNLEIRLQRAAKTGQ